MQPDGSQTSKFCQAKTLAGLLREGAAAYGDDPALVSVDDDGPRETLSYVELERRSAQLARGLLARGVGKGIRIGFIAGNGPLFAILLGAIARIGAVAIPVSTLLKSGELVRVLRHSDLHGLIVQRSLLGKDYVERLREALPQLDAANLELRLTDVPYLRWIVAEGGGLPSGVRGFDWIEQAADDISEEHLQAIEAEVTPADQVVEIYTSGSMALPKGVKHLHGPVMSRARYIAAMAGFKRGAEVPAVMPMFWVGGMGMYLLPGLVCGGTVICTEGTLSNSRYSMGSVLAEEDLAVMAKVPKPWWALGMSETYGPYSYGDEFRAEGYPVCAPLDNIAEGYDVRVADEDDQPVADGEVGEIQVRGYALTPGLHKLERADYFTADGYYRTGDLGLVDGRRIHFVGRKGDMIKTAGSNVSPAEVEMELQALDGVHSAYVVGLPDKERGQLVVAALVAREGASPLDVDAIEAEMKARLSSYKVPRAMVEIAREEVPMLASNKVARRELAAMLAAWFDRPATN